MMNDTLFERVKRAVLMGLWKEYVKDLDIISRIQTALMDCFGEVLHWDHLALIDLPGPVTGIKSLSELFFLLDYQPQGKDYLSDKQNEFVWLTEISSLKESATKALPQIVVADFRRAELPENILTIIDFYACQATHLPIAQLRYLKNRILCQDELAAEEFVRLVLNYLNKRDWPTPTVEEFNSVNQFNELLAWVLLMGRQVNHFGWAIHLSEYFSSLKALNEFIIALNIPLNRKGGVIKGNCVQGIEQSSTAPIIKKIKLANGEVQLPSRFIEFVWRFPLNSENPPFFWKDYFTGFVAPNANRVVESLYR